jgi:hypothetical protein
MYGLFNICAFYYSKHYRVAAIFLEHFQSFTVLLKNNSFYNFFYAKPSQLSAETETKTNSHIRAKMNQQESAGAGAVSGPCAGRTIIELLETPIRALLRRCRMRRSGLPARLIVILLLFCVGRI